MAQFGMYALIGDRPQRRGRPDRSARPRLRRLLRRSAPTPSALLTSPDSPWNLTGRLAAPRDWAWLAAVPVAIAVTALSGLLLGSPTLRLRGDYLAIVTLGFGEIVRLLADNLDRADRRRPGPLPDRLPASPGSATNAERGLLGRQHRLAPLNSGAFWFWLSMVLIIIVLVIVGNLERSRVGRAWVAIREDEDAAEIMGVPTFKFKLWAFVIGASIGGLSGALYAGQVQFVVPTTFNVINSMLFLCAVVLGGQGNKLGVIVGRVHHRVPAQLLPRAYPAVRHPDQRQRDRQLQVPVLRAGPHGPDDLPAAGSDSRRGRSCSPTVARSTSPPDGPTWRRQPSRPRHRFRPRSVHPTTPREATDEHPRRHGRGSEDEEQFRAPDDLISTRADLNEIYLPDGEVEIAVSVDVADVQPRAGRSRDGSPRWSRRSARSRPRSASRCCR